MIATDDLTTLQSATEFQNILNQQDPNIQYTMDVEDTEKTLQFLELKITNVEGKYTISIYMENAITNVQVKPHSGHDPKILKGIFTDFLHRAYSTCQSTQRERRSGLPDQTLLKMDTTTTR